jgi:hypothetical protein
VLDDRHCQSTAGSVSAARDGGGGLEAWDVKVISQGTDSNVARCDLPPAVAHDIGIPPEAITTM